MADTYLSDLKQALLDYESAIANAEKTVTLAEKSGTTAQVAEANDYLNQLMDIAPTIETLRKATSGTASYTGEITQETADMLNAQKSATSMSSTERGEYGAEYGGTKTYYAARDALIPGLENNRSDLSYSTSGASGISNTGKKYVNGQLVNDEEWQNFLRTGNVGGITMFGGGSGGGGGGGGTTTSTSKSVASAGGYNSAGFPVPGGQYNAYGDWVGQGMSPNQKSMFSFLSDRFKKYGLESLVPKIKQLIISGATEDTITIELQESEEYQQRFKANKERTKKGLAVLNPADYIRVEDAYRQTLRAYGLNQFDNDDYVSQFIANDMSPAELSSRVNMAVQRLRDADKEITKTLRDYYNLGDTDILGYMLDPEKQLPALQRQVTAAEIGTAARKQGLAVASATAEELAAKGVTQAEAEQGYATIADILPTAQKLSDIYGGTLEGYNLTEAEQEVFGQLASAQRKRKTLAKREVSTFGGTSGLGRSSLSSQSGGGF